MIQVAGGSVTGSGHQHKLNVRNNQDAFAWTIRDEEVCAVICDGCSSGSQSEVGAWLFAQKISSYVNLLTWHMNAGDEDIIRQDYILPALETLAKARSMGTNRKHINLPRVIKDYFLFTIVGVAISKVFITVFSIGDGVAYFNGEKIELPEYPNNAPPYLAYELIQDSLKNPTPELYKFQIHAQIPVDEFETCLIGSDGVKDLDIDISEFWTEDKYFQNPDSIRRRLAKINERKIVDGREKLGPLSDDTTLVAIRRQDES